ncbi:hypothetical protein P170DRAFT_466003 [Aspergillus steynii IBT 23096]|uniref:N-acetyltransferase domain-containing protein n=1 Tax=Aspergillus steynii IBT 23096 TaxID=1392250 RepID=A0A2I2G0U3_9EURO|nr:uncharacterized protein P170DRAFT_466003 [Aspergillus steynii IBT 23096]PLB46504.1 hypothetical protein P170DRAFT_466003 [Aspergillus steynii IBT 23096]
MSITNIALIPGTTTDHGTLDTLIDRYKNIRLRALKEEPQAFGSKYEDELQFPHHRWQARIQNPRAHTFIALNVSPGFDVLVKSAGDSDPSLPVLLTTEWLGTLTMIGPEAVPDSNLDAKELLDLFDRNRAISSGDGTHGSVMAYVLNGMFVAPEGRRSGNGRRLVERAVGYARDAATAVGAVQVWMLVFVEVENGPAFEFYQKFGFQAWDGEVLLGHRYVRMLDLRIVL